MRVRSSATAKRPIRSIALAILSASALIGGFVAQPAAATTTDAVAVVDAQQMLSTQVHTYDDWQPLPADKRDALVAKNADQLVPTSHLEFDESRAEALQADDGRTLIRIPAEAGQGVVNPSSFNLFLDADGERLVVMETAFVEENAAAGSARIWTDGKLTFDRSIDLSDEIITAGPDTSGKNGLAKSSGYVKGDWWGNLNKCLSANGIAAWAAALLAAACAAACVVTAGAGCIACLAVLTGGTSGVISSCIYQANKYS